MKNKISKVIDIRPGKWPEYYDECNVKEYQEYFIKGTNIKLGFKYIHDDSVEWEYCCIISESYDDQIWFETEEELFKHFEWILMNKDLIWRYYE